MVNNAWSGQLEVEFLLQVFTIRQANIGLVFRISLQRSVRTQRGLTAAGGQKGRFSTVADNIGRV
jgi:hypothetical protein